MSELFWLLLMTTLLLLGSALASGTEAALMTVSPVRVHQLAQGRIAGGRSLQRIKHRMGRALTVIVILNNVVNIFGSLMLGGYAAWVIGDRYGLANQWVAAFSTLFTLLVICFGEILPKAFGTRLNESVALLAAPVLMLLMRLLMPLVVLLERLMPVLTASNTLTTDEREIRLLARLGSQQGQIEADEAAMISKVFQLNDLTARDLMIPRVAAPPLAADVPLTAVRAELLATDQDWWVVLGEEVDEVVGVVSREDLLAALLEGRGSARVCSLVDPVRYVPEMIRADRLLGSFRRARDSVRVVVDEFGAFTGVVGPDALLAVLAGWRRFAEEPPHPVGEERA